SALARARQFRDGLMVALLAVCPIRLKNLAGLEIGRTFKQIRSSWWIVLPASETKERRADERPAPDFLTQWVDRYLKDHRPILAHTNDALASLWLAANDGQPLGYDSVASIISRTTLATLGVDVSPHLFRTSAGSTAAMHAGQTPHLASALLHHTDPAVTEEHYNRASITTAATAYANGIGAYRKGFQQGKGELQKPIIKLINPRYRWWLGTRAAMRQLKLRCPTLALYASTSPRILKSPIDARGICRACSKVRGPWPQYHNKRMQLARSGIFSGRRWEHAVAAGKAISTFPDCQAMISAWTRSTLCPRGRKTKYGSRHGRR